MKPPDVPGRSTVWPCLMVGSIQEELQFLKKVFDAQLNQEIDQQERSLWQVKVRLGDTLLLLGRATKEDNPAAGMLYVQVEDVEGTFSRAMDSGATLISAPTEQPSGDLEAGFKDPQGVIWWIGRRMKRPSNREVQQRLTAQRKKRS